MRRRVVSAKAAGCFRLCWHAPAVGLQLWALHCWGSARQTASSAGARKEASLSVLVSEKQRQLLAELEGVPEEYYPFLLQMIRNYRESVLLQPAAESFRRGWEEAQNNDTSPVARLWEGIDAE